jgi:hypothetical protein
MEDRRTFIVYVSDAEGRKFYPHYIPSQKIYIMKDTLHGTACFKSRNRAEEFIQAVGPSARNARIEEIFVDDIERTDLPMWTKMQEKANS